ncbi:divalent-cation tolerance protein CutA [Asticcacaulis solisilvae]|uniref:divalent-cation tolerance protein CutA n=1 Tax=Asticcacaulis solisilvae TaxID=1217274 RepID=UPI003FD775DA
MLARRLVEARLAACVQTHPIASTYAWQGEIETSAEIMLTAKTVADKLAAIEALVKKHHSYDVPEILAQPVVWVSTEYEAWLRDTIA